jgi:hypothetical protein
VIVSRTAFLKLCGAALVGGSVPRWALPDDSVAASPGPASAASGAARFSPHVGSLFILEDTGQRLRLRDVAESAVSPGIEQFALHFTSTGPAITHGTYAFRHPALGRVEMFITPVGAPAHGPVYQACFSRIVRAREA